MCWHTRCARTWFSFCGLSLSAWRPKLDIRLVQTALDLVQVILTHRHRALGLLLTELGGYLLSPAQAPAGAKRISNLIHAPDWSADDIGALLWQQATERVQAL